MRASIYGMSIQINKASEASVREQLTAQLELMIATGELRAADPLPSVRALGRRLKIHHNTVSQVYGDLVRAGLLVRRRGARVVVRTLDGSDGRSSGRDLDDILNGSIQLAEKAGYSLQEYRRHVLERFSAAPPEHVLIVAAESAFGDLLRAELAEALHREVRVCLFTELERNPEIASGALIVSHLTLMPKLGAVLGKQRTLLAIQYSDTAYCASLIGQLTQPSIIALVSVSEYVLTTARLVLSPLLGDRHTISVRVVNAGAPLDIGAADVILCDHLIYQGLTAREKKFVVPYRVISTASVRQIQSMIPARG